jgi:uncharacterized membrane protein
MNDRKFSTRDVTTIGMLAALCVVGTTIKVPFGQGAMVHLGSAAIFTSGLLFGGVYAGLGGAIGSAFFDILMGFSPYTLWSFFIKGIAGYIAGTVSHSGGTNGRNFVRDVLALILAAAWTLAGYLVAWTAVIGKWEVAFLNWPASVMTSTAGIIVAIPLSFALRGPLQAARLIRSDRTKGN